jgi:hypothetical protein
VGIAATPISSTSYGHIASRTVSIHLIPPGIILPPTDPTAPIASFSYSPLGAKAGTQLTFDASASQAMPGRTIDGQSATRSGPFEDHDYPNPGTYPVVLTVVDNAGVAGYSLQVIDVVP